MNFLSAIPMATPYLWPDGELVDEDSETVVQAELATEGTPGFSYLQAQMLKNDGMSDSAKRILMRLLQEQNVDLKGRPSNMAQTASSSPSVATVAIDSSMDEETVLDLAAKGQISLLGSILAIIDKHSSASAVSSKHIIKEVALTVDPSRTPGLLDAREMVLAALHFLSQRFTPNEDEEKALVALPLIRPLSITGDLERRSYEKAVPWILKDIMKGVAALEECFYSSDSDFQWLSREKFLPAALQMDPDVDELFLKGTLPLRLQLQLPSPPPQSSSRAKGASKSARKKAGAEESKPPAKKKQKTKASSPSASPSPTTVRATKDPIRAEVLQIFAETNSPDSDTTEEEDEIDMEDDDIGGVGAYNDDAAQDDDDDDDENDDVDDDDDDDSDDTEDDERV